MQQYQVNLPMLLCDWYFDPIFQGGILVWGIIVVLITRYFKKKKLTKRLSVSDEATYSSSIIGFIGALIVFWVIAPLFFGLSHMGDGYKIKNNAMYLEAAPEQITIIIPEASVKLVKKDTEWQVKRRIHGSGTYHLLTGWCELENGKKALVFKHRSNPYMIVIQQNENYYLLAHPGVEKLYQELIDRGAKENLL
jgi:hypothetical protein